jgi:hypothetical protein
MKLGRNDPCSCGSGKKYKHCCMNTASKQHAEIADDVEQIVAMNPNLTLDELNVVMQHKVHERNNRPNPELCGLSPTQIDNWLYAPFDQKEGLNIVTPADLSASPVMRYLALILDEAVQHEGSFKATSKGNLPAKLVKQASALLPEFAVCQYSKNISISEFAGSNEDKFNALHYARVLAEMAGIIDLRSGCYQVKKPVQKQYQAEGIQAFFKPMLEAATSKYNWGYLDYFEQNLDLRSFWLFMLWRLQNHASVDLLIDDVVTTFPSVLQQLVPDEYLPTEKLLSILIESRFIERFLEFWGFIVIDPKRFANGLPIARKAQLQPLLAHTFQFTI